MIYQIQFWLLAVSTKCYVGATRRPGTPKFKAPCDEECKGTCIFGDTKYLLGHNRQRNTYICTLRELYDLWFHADCKCSGNSRETAKVVHHEYLRHINRLCMKDLSKAVAKITREIAKHQYPECISKTLQHLREDLRVRATKVMFSLFKKGSESWKEFTESVAKLDDRILDRMESEYADRLKELQEVSDEKINAFKEALLMVRKVEGHDGPCVFHDEQRWQFNLGRNTDAKNIAEQIDIYVNDGSSSGETLLEAEPIQNLRTLKFLIQFRARSIATGDEKYTNGVKKFVGYLRYDSSEHVAKMLRLIKKEKGDHKLDELATRQLNMMDSYLKRYPRYTYRYIRKNN